VRDGKLITFHCVKIRFVNHMKRAFTYGLPSLRLGAANVGQLGRPEDPGSQEIMKNVVMGSCGLLHSLLVRDDGTVFSFGKAAGGRLGNGNDIEDCYEPHPSFKLRSSKDVKSISSGSMHNIITTAEGELLAWGYDSVSSTASSLSYCASNLQFVAWPGWMSGTAARCEHAHRHAADSGAKQ
jgi:hypothetical protein